MFPSEEGRWYALPRGWLNGACNTLSRGVEGVQDVADRTQGRRVLVYTIYTGTRDTTPRLKQLLETAGFKIALLRAQVDASRREDWIAEQENRGTDLLITHPALVRSGLDLLI